MLDPQPTSYESFFGRIDRDPPPAPQRASLSSGTDVERVRVRLLREAGVRTRLVVRDRRRGALKS